MKKKIAYFVCGLLLSSGSVAMADQEWGVFGSYWSPSDGDDSFGVGAKLAIEMVDSVQLDIRISRFDDIIGGPAGSPELEVTPLEIGLSVAVGGSEDIQPYFGFGIGSYMMDADSGGGAAIDVNDETGYYVSAGIEWILSRSGADYGETFVKLFIEGIYRVVEADNIVPTSTPGVFADADLDGPGAQFGLLIAW